MSYDIEVFAPNPEKPGKPCSKCGHAELQDEVFFSRNYTWNILPMITLAADRAGLSDRSCYWPTVGTVPANVAGPNLRAILTEMGRTPSDFRALNPENGWGDYDSFLSKILVDLVDVLESHPDGRLVIG